VPGVRRDLRGARLGHRRVSAGARPRRAFGTRRCALRAAARAAAQRADAECRAGGRIVQAVGDGGGVGPAGCRPTDSRPLFRAARPTPWLARGAGGPAAIMAPLVVQRLHERPAKKMRARAPAYARCRHTTTCRRPRCPSTRNRGPSAADESARRRRRFHPARASCQGVRPWCGFQSSCRRPPWRRSSYPTAPPSPPACAIRPPARQPAPARRAAARASARSAHRRAPDARRGRAPAETRRWPNPAPCGSLTIPGRRRRKCSGRVCMRVCPKTISRHWRCRTGRCGSMLPGAAERIALQVREVNSGAAKRHAREKVLEAARRRESDVVLSWRLDRWGRSVADLLATLQELEHLGVGFVSLTVARAVPVAGRRRAPLGTGPRPGATGRES